MTYAKSAFACVPFRAKRAVVPRPASDVGRDVKPAAGFREQPLRTMPAAPWHQATTQETGPTGCPGTADSRASSPEWRRRSRFR